MPTYGVLYQRPFVEHVRLEAGYGQGHLESRPGAVSLRQICPSVRDRPQAVEPDLVAGLAVIYTEPAEQLRGTANEL